VILPPIPRPLKRSASTASLPTPPRSHRKLARGKSRGSCDSDSDEHVALTSDRSDDELLEKRHKKRRIGTTKKVDELAVWPNTPTTVSSTYSPPETPKTRSSTRRALRDSPDNPFLATPENHADDSESSANPSPHEPLQERPTIAYVFRGVRRECRNPLYNHAQDRPFSPPPESKLAIDHPDYSPSIHCAPKRLFPDAYSKRKKKPSTSSKRDPVSRKRARQRSPSLSADEADVGEIRPKKLNFGQGKKRAGGSTLDQEL